MISRYSSKGKGKNFFVLPLEQLKCVCGKLHRQSHISYHRLSDMVMCQDWELSDEGLMRIKRLRQLQ